MVFIPRRRATAGQDRVNTSLRLIQPPAQSCAIVTHMSQIHALMSELRYQPQQHRAVRIEYLPVGRGLTGLDDLIPCR